MTAELISEINRRLHKSLTKDPNVLACIVTGKTRTTNTAYLQNKAIVAGSVERFVEHYICREALTLLKSGKSINEVRQMLSVPNNISVPSKETLSTALAINGK